MITAITPKIYNNTSQPQFKGKPKESLNEELQKEGVNLNLTPLQSGLAIGATTFLMCLGVDRLLATMKFFKYPLKYALAVNGLIGAVIGVQAYFNEKKASNPVSK